MLLIGFIFFMVSQAITYFCYCNKRINTAYEENFEENLLELYRTINQIDFEAAPLKISKNPKEISFAFKPPLHLRGEHPYLTAKIIEKDQEILFQSQPLKGVKWDSIKLGSTTSDLGIQVIGFQFQEKKRSLILVDQFDEKSSMIPIAIRVDLGTKVLDIPIPLKLEDQNILHLRLTPTRSQCS